jgi:hypothetical protein
VEGVCTECDVPCAECKYGAGTCTACLYDYHLFNSTCVEFCPDKYEANDLGQCVLVGLICPLGFKVSSAGNGCVPDKYQCKSGFEINEARTACVPAPGSVIPFPFFFFALCCGILVLASHIKAKKQTRIVTCLIAFIGSLELFMYFVMLICALTTEKWLPFCLILAAMVVQIAANIYFYMLYSREMCRDPLFQKWQRLNPKYAMYVPIAATIVNFKLIRLLYSGYFGLDQF